MPMKHKREQLARNGRRAMLGVPMDDEDWAAIKAAAKAEKLPMTEVARRAIRHYAKSLGLTPTPTP